MSGDALSPRGSSLHYRIGGGVATRGSRVRDRPWPRLAYRYYWARLAVTRNTSSFRVPPDVTTTPIPEGI